MAKRKIKTQGIPVGQIIQQLREAEGINMAELSRRVDVTRNHICEIESGDCFPSYALLTKIYNEFGYEMSIKKIPYQPTRKNKKRKVRIATDK